MSAKLPTVQEGADRGSTGPLGAFVQGSELRARVAKVAAKDPAGMPRLQKPGKNGQRLPVGRPKGTPNKVTQTIREAVELAAKQCHPAGFAGWLVERAQGGIEDRKIFAGVVARAMPIQAAIKSDSTVTINLPWLAGRGINGARAAQIGVIDAQVIDSQGESVQALLTDNQASQKEGGGE